MNNPNEFPNSNSIYDQGKYAYGPNEEYEDDNYGGVDPNDMDYYDDSQDNDEDHGDDYSANNEDDDLFHTYSGVVHTSPAPDLLLAILEAAVRDDETLTRDAPQSNGGFPEDVQRNLRDHLERTWKAVRTHWLWAFETAEERSAGALLRGANGLAPLHLVCKLDGNPPTDVWEAIVEAAPEVAGWLDSHGWLPLHHACLRGSSTEVLKLLTEVCPSARAALDAHRRTPLHLYATRGTNSDNHPSTMARNYRILCAWSAEDDEESWSPAEARDAAGMLPMHYACAYGTTRSVLRVLEEAFPDGLEARDDHGRTPLHLVMVNAQRSASPGVLGYILGHVDDENGDEADHYGDGNLKFEIATIGARRIPKSASVNVRDRGGNLPLHLLNLGLVGADLDRDRDKRNHASECLQLYLEAQPHVSTDFLAALQALPEPLQDVAVVSPHVRNILNAKIIQRFPTSILVSH
jgi:ankyrin repeat protein